MPVPEDTSVSQPFDRKSPSQLPQPGRHVPPHIPAWQVTVAIWEVLHGAPHEPQFATSLIVLASQPSIALLLLQSE